MNTTGQPQLTTNTVMMSWSRFEELFKKLDAANISLARDPHTGEWTLGERQKNNEGHWCAYHFKDKMKGPLVPMLEEYFYPNEETQK